ncbi:5'-methylthioadenosine/S-adenosylhomocysteine nucleosidase [Spirochaetia bacterium]|nr:5'-methylthioadenosine/S-adenosylhomocysteine nucleosidase [Spirochaetia bacterium]
MYGIIGAMEDEVKLLRHCLRDAKTETAGEFEFYIGKIYDRPAVVLRSGIGKVQAAVGCALLIQRYNPTLVINTGSAGGIDPGLVIGDAVVSTGLLYYDVDVTAFNYALGQLPGQPAVFPVAEDLVSRAEKAIDALKTEKVLPEDFNHLRGIIASGDQFMHRPEQIAALRKNFPEVKAVEMEGAAIAHCCKLFNVPSLIIRALSDVAGTESPVTHDEFLAIASKHSAEIVRRIISNM